MNYSLKNWILLLLGCVCITSCISDDAQEGTIQLVVGDAVPAFTLSLNSGQTVTAESLKGKPSVIVFFNTGCKDCQQELPVLQRAFESYPQLNWVCISREEKVESIQSFWDAHQLTLPYSAQTDRTLYHLFAKSGIPRVYVTDKDGIIRFIFTDAPLATFTDLSAAIEACL